MDPFDRHPNYSDSCTYPSRNCPNNLVPHQIIEEMDLYPQDGSWSDIRDTYRCEIECKEILTAYIIDDSLDGEKVANISQCHEEKESSNEEARVVLNNRQEIVEISKNDRLQATNAPSNFEGFVSSGMIYTEKEQALHISGPIEPIPHIPSYEISPYYIANEQLYNFFEDGYFIMSEAVSQDALLRARTYIDDNYKSWIRSSKRQDDWRIHFQLNFLNPSEVIDHSEILNVLISSQRIMKCLTSLLGCHPSGIFYTQIALRTPYKKGGEVKSDYQDGAEYHLDGNANNLGIRFPDPWTVMVGVALVDIDTECMGNFTVFPKSHVSRNWKSYPIEKQSKTLPNLGTPTKVSLKAGDAVFVHVLLAHRGGKNISDKRDYQQIDDAFCPKNIPINTREMIFYRIQGENLDYLAPDRAERILNNPWHEFEYVLQHHNVMI